MQLQWVHIFYYKIGVYCNLVTRFNGTFVIDERNGDLMTFSLLEKVTFFVITVLIIFWQQLCTFLLIRLSLCVSITSWRLVTTTWILLFGFHTFIWEILIIMVASPTFLALWCKAFSTYKHGFLQVK